MVRMRTAVGVLNIIKAEDPGSEVALHYIRKIINTNRVPVTPVGRKKLVDADAVISYIAAGGPPDPEAGNPVTGQIRRVPV